MLCCSPVFAIENQQNWLITVDTANRVKQNSIQNFGANILQLGKQSDDFHFFRPVEKEFNSTYSIE